MDWPISPATSQHRRFHWTLNRIYKRARFSHNAVLEMNLPAFRVLRAVLKESSWHNLWDGYCVCSHVNTMPKYNTIFPRVLWKPETWLQSSVIILLCPCVICILEICMNWMYLKGLDSGHSAHRAWLKPSNMNTSWINLQHNAFVVRLHQSWNQRNGHSAKRHQIPIILFRRLVPQQLHYRILAKGLLLSYFWFSAVEADSANNLIWFGWSLWLMTYHKGSAQVPQKKMNEYAQILMGQSIGMVAIFK